MSKIRLISLIFLTSHAWSDGSCDPIPPTSPAAIAFPYSPDQEWFTQEALLIWRPYIEDVDYANRLETSISPLTPKPDFPFGSVNFDVRPKKPDFEWSTGIRLGIGRYLNHDLWDVGLYATYFYGEADDHSSPSRDKNAILLNTWDPSMEGIGGATKGSMHWHLNFFTCDLSFGREYLLLRNLTAHPFFGLRGAAIYQNYRSKLFDNFTDAAGVEITRLEKFSAKDRFVGVGPRAGSDFSFNFGKHWAIVGSFSGAFFWGEYHAREKISAQNLTGRIFGINNRFHAKDHDFDVRTQIEGSLGLAWENWVNHNSVRIAPSINFEASTWFAMNDLFTLTFGPTPSFLSLSRFDATRRNGDMSFVGVNLNLHIDF